VQEVAGSNPAAPTIFSFSFDFRAFTSWPAFCLRAIVTRIASKINRSRLYHLLNTINPVNHKRIARLDTYGGLIITGLLLILLNLLRFFAS
jgi:hypothetical protein